MFLVIFRKLYLRWKTIILIQWAINIDKFSRALKPSYIIYTVLLIDNIINISSHFSTSHKLFPLTNKVFSKDCGYFPREKQSCWVSVKAGTCPRIEFRAQPRRIKKFIIATFNYVFIFRVLCRESPRSPFTGKRVTPILGNPSHCRPLLADC